MRYSWMAVRSTPAMLVLACAMLGSCSLLIEPGGSRDRTDGSPPGDGPPAQQCPAFCSTCEEATGRCQIDCQAQSCSNIICPAGFECTLQCQGDGACAAGDISCTGSCVINCDGDAACETITVRCGGDECSIFCVGKDACDNGVHCDATSCAVLCSGSFACEDGGGACCNSAPCGSRCTAQNGGLCSCTL